MPNRFGNKGNTSASNERHNWITTDKKSVSKCTKCKCLRYWKDKVMVYELEGELVKALKCK